MRRHHLIQTSLAAVVAIASLALSRPAFADALPPTACSFSAHAGQACTTAGNGTEDGVCVSETCHSAIHEPDGGIGSSSYPCLICELPDGGSPTKDAGPEDSGPQPDHDSGPQPEHDAGPTPPPADAGQPDVDSGNGDHLGGPGKVSSPPNDLTGSSNCSMSMGGSGSGASFFALGAMGLAVFGASRRRRRS